MLDRLSELPAGQSGGKQRLSPHTRLHTHTHRPDPPLILLPSAHTLGRILACAPSTCLWALCGCRSASGHEKPPASKPETRCRRGLGYLPLAPLLMKLQGERKQTRGCMQINTRTVSQQDKCTCFFSPVQYNVFSAASDAASKCIFTK